MRNLMDSLENAAYALQDLGKKALDSAAERLEKASPNFRQGVNEAWNACEAGAEKAAASAKSALKKARPAVGDSIDHAFESARAACEKAVEEPRNARAEQAEDAEEAPPAPGSDEALDLDVEETLAKIQSAKTEPNIISDYIARKYNRDGNEPTEKE